MKAAIWKGQSRVQSFHEWKNRVNPSVTASPGYNHIKILCLRQNVLLPGIMTKIAKIEVEDRNTEARLKGGLFCKSNVVILTRGATGKNPHDAPEPRPPFAF
jgi:hypothetical protein